ncbi:phage holin family protein [Halodesulfovibrio sp.]|uniref:phage holin family protein n=1 Tax=Halodesulfovibrio sp. TaxID=1912772 RepID=UPI0025B950F1|nr:phage holin family protein [Halodesulfovibrio sp.]
MQDLTNYLQEMGSNMDVKSIFSVFAAGAAAVFGGSVPLVYALTALWALDFILGFKRAWDGKSLSGRKFRAGAMKIVLYVMTVVVMGLAEYSLGALGTFLPLRDITIAYLCMTEALSCIEHLSFFGVPIPKGVRERLRSYRDCLHECDLPQGDSK